MAVKIRLKRMGKIRAPFYRVVVMDSRTKRDGRAIEEIGIYHPTRQPSVIEIDSERAQYWLGVGAQPTEQVAALLKVTGDWQKFRGEPGAEGTLQVAEPKQSKKDAYEAALAAAGAADDSFSKNPPKKPSELKAEKEAAEKKAAEEAEKKAAEEAAKAEAEASAAEAAEAPAEESAPEAGESTEAAEATETAENKDEA